MPREQIHLEDDGDGMQSVVLQWGRDHGSINIGTARHQPNEPTLTGSFVDLTTRGATNELIRKLRRARDQAFGKDE